MGSHIIHRIGSRLRKMLRHDRATPLRAMPGTIRRLDCVEYEDRILFSATPAGGEVLVNTETTSVQSIQNETQQAVAADPTGAFVVAWASDSQDGTGTGIYAQRFDATGNKQGAEFQVNTTILGDQTEAAVAKAADGTFVVAWSGPILDVLGITILGEGIYFQRYDAAGSRIGPEQQVALALLEDFHDPSIAINAAGDFTISWTRAFGDGSGDAVFARQFHANGSPDGLAFLVNTAMSGDQNLSTVAYDAAGNFIVVWTSAAQDGSGTGVYGRRFDAAGNPLGAEFRINTTTAGNQTEAAVATDGAGNFLVTWSSQAQDGSGYGVYGQRFDSTGAKVGGETAMNVTTAGDQRESRIAMDASGSFVVAWTSTNQDAAGGDGVYFRQFDATGTAISSETLVNRTITGSQQSPSVAMQSSNGFVVAWSGNGAGDADGVFLQRFIDGTNVAPIHTLPGTQATLEDTPLVFSSGMGNGIGIADAGAASNPIRVTLTTTSGTTTLGSTSGLTFSTGDGTADAVMTFTGMIVDINAALNGLTFMPTLDFAGTATLGVVSNDLGYSGTGGPQTTSSNISITVTPVNDHTPTMTSNGGGASANVSAAENTTSVTTVAASDADLPTPSLNYSISGGTDAGRFMIDGATGALSFVVAPDFEAPADSDGDDVYQVIVRASDGTFFTTQTIFVTVTNVNEPAIITLPSAQATNEDTALVFSTAGGNAIAVADPDAAGLPLQMTLAGTNGSISLSGTSGLTFLVGDGTDDALMIFQGTSAAMNAALNGAAFHPTANFYGAAQLQVSVDDLGHNGSGPAQITTATLSLAVDSVNDAPSLTLPGAQTTAFQTGLIFSTANGRAMVVGDNDAGSGSIELTLNANHGTLTLAQTAGLTFVVGDGTSDDAITVRGSLSNLNSALDGLQFSPNESYRGSTGFAVSVDDLGLNGGGGARTAAAQVAVVVQPTADRIQLRNPIALSADNYLAVFSPTTGSGITIEDAYAEDPRLTVTLTAHNGTVALAQTAGLTFVDGAGSSGALLAFSGTLTNVNAALAGLRFRGIATNGEVSLVVTDEPRDGMSSQTIQTTIAISQAAVFPSPQPETMDDHGAGGSSVGRSEVALIPGTSSHDVVFWPTISLPRPTLLGMLENVRQMSGFDTASLLDRESKITHDERPPVLPSESIDDDTLYADRCENVDWSSVSSAGSKATHGVRTALLTKGPVAAKTSEGWSSQEASIPWQTIVATIEEQAYTTVECLVVGTAGITATLTVGYLVWSLQAGSLTSILLSSLPTWKAFDPLPVLEYERRRNPRMHDVDELDSVFDTRSALGAR
ncbi:MAG: cadherin repeat domain-containing protein [Planctomycetia bacterium]|nr:cadherin repeat domain-containing protein [Planctomycetia bacterium]